MRMPRWIGLAVVLAAGVVCPQLTAADTPPDSAALVRLLGSPLFAEREAAERQLKALGPACLPAVTAGLASPDPEIARRCGVIRKHVREAEAAAFVAGKKELDSAAWKRLKGIVGDSPESRKLFAAMTADDGRAAAIDAAEANPAKAHEVYAAAVERAKDARAKAIAPFLGKPIGDDSGKAAQTAIRAAVPPAEVATVLFIGSHPLPNGTHDPPKPYAVLAANLVAGVDGPHKIPFRKLFVAWLDQRRNPDAVWAGMRTVLFCGLPEALPVARRRAADKDLPAWAVGQVLLVLGNHGTKDDLPSLIARRDDDRMVGHWTADGKPPNDRTQVRDVATAMALHLCGQDFQKFGFELDEYIDWTTRPGIAPFKAVGGRFKTAEDREAAHKKAWDWLDRQPKPAAGKGGSPSGR